MVKVILLFITLLMLSLTLNVALTAVYIAKFNNVAKWSNNYKYSRYERIKKFQKLINRKRNKINFKEQK